ncbi:glycoside hydrolase family 2 TIM barrel-domain containing protein [uncultured Sphaerochaeta sp.]|uniref:glycoside hydrolase family 2 protein n=1 Tax=uncultured Sphaerochaeta sp. TaxID=886478 RepID=UPI0029CA4CEF|nr:glycoside hydrolase family 2 TIM barrel-domain containing protein [uncultured Sphaerochaeta sp.]
MKKAENFNQDIHVVDYRLQYEENRATAETLMSIEGREIELLNGPFHFSPDPYETCLRAKWFKEKKISDNGLPLPIDSDFEGWPTINVPSCWNTECKDLYYYESTALYFKTFKYKEHHTGERVFLHFEGSSYRTYVFLNGKVIGMHDGASTPFSFEVTDTLIPDENRLIIAVDASRSKDRVPMDNTDWFNYGGIYRDIMLIRTPATYIQNFFSQLQPHTTNEIFASVTMDKKINGKAVYRIAELDIEKEIPIKQGKGSIVFKADLQLWSPENPKLYTVEISTEDDALCENIGFRDIQVDGINILLNGKPIFLKGISVHEDHIILGKSTNEQVIRDTIADLKEMHGNFIRLAHYPHTRLFSKIADEMGVLLWEEIPVYWAINFTNKATYADAENQLAELIIRDRNRASVIIWSVGNENPDTDARLSFMSSLAKKTRELDPTRLVSAACLVNTAKLKLEDRLMEHLDIIGNNEYYGWYEPNFEDLLTILNNTDLTKPVIITEFGGGARAGNHGTKDTMWTEEFQEALYIKQFTTLDKAKYVRGMTPWIFYDFRAVRRLNRYQEGFNRKGLIDSDRKTKKLAFYVTQKYYKTKG